MTTIERQFLIEAFKSEEHLRPKPSADRIVPLLSWRSIGVLCDLTGEESDELVRRLAASGHVHLVDGERRLILLGPGRDVGRAGVEAGRRRFWRYIHWVLIPLLVIAYVLVREMRQ